MKTLELVKIDRRTLKKGVGKKPVWSDRGERWDGLREAAEAIGRSKAAVSIAIHKAVRCKGRFLSYEELDGATIVKCPCCKTPFKAVAGSAPDAELLRQFAKELHEMLGRWGLTI